MSFSLFLKDLHIKKTGLPQRSNPEYLSFRLYTNGYTTYVLEVVLPLFSVHAVWKNSPRALSTRS